MRKEVGSVLITLLIFTAVAITVTSGAITVAVINTQGISKFSQSETAFHIAEAGMENALIRLLRNRDYAGESLAVGDGTATITVSGSPTVTIESEGFYQSFRRTIQVTGTLDNNAFDISDWKEVD